MVMDIDVDFHFTDDCDYWKTYGKTRPGHSDRDPDKYSQTLKLYQQKLYNRKTPCGLTIDLQSNDDYLVWDSMRFGSDAIINMYAYQLPEVEKEIENYDKIIKNCIYDSYTIGGEIIFPKHRMSINQYRGINHKIRDRFDLTLECIRLFYEGKDSPLYNVLETDKIFFKLFGSFKNYIDFFFLNDLVLPNGRVNFFLDTGTDVFNRNDPRPQNKQEWLQLWQKQENFLKQRNERIKDFVSKH